MPRPKNPQTECAFEGCDRGGKLTKGLCAAHYMQLRSGKPLRPLRPHREQNPMKNDLPCEYIACDRLQYAKGLCRGHHNQSVRGMELAPLRAYTKKV